MMRLKGKSEQKRFLRESTRKGLSNRQKDRFRGQVAGGREDALPVFDAARVAAIRLWCDKER